MGDIISLQFASISSIVNTFGAIIGVSALVLVAFVYLYSTAKHGREDIVRQDNTDLRASNEGLRAEKLADKATITQQRDDINHLRALATQTPAVTQLISLIQSQQKLQGSQHTSVIMKLTDLTGEISNLTKALSSNFNSKKEAKNGKSRA